MLATSHYAQCSLDRVVGAPVSQLCPIPPPKRYSISATLEHSRQTAVPLRTARSRWAEQP